MECSRRQRAFTIVELLVAMALVGVLLAISGVVFRHSVQAYRAASATAEIMQKYQGIVHQLKTDLSGLQKGAEFVVVWAPSPYRLPDNTILDENKDGVPDRYLSFDRLYFFASGSFQTFRPQTDTSGSGKIVHSNLARICYLFGREADGGRAGDQVDPRKRLFCRTQHLLTSDSSLPAFPDFSSGWNETVFENQNFSLEYQTMALEDWLNLDFSVYKREILAKVLDLRMENSQAIEGGPRIDFSTPQTTANTVHLLLCKGVGQFHVQIWERGYQRWWPEIDPNYDGDYSDADTQRWDGTPNGYRLAGNRIDDAYPRGYYILRNSSDFDNQIGSALKFTFTLYDSKGVFPEGKTFTYIVYLNP
jgi:prepilin-type N-terminal cleavage/methylation domain-containing protein